jgi:hypothetical protein
MRRGSCQELPPILLVLDQLLSLSLGIMDFLCIAIPLA